MRAPHTFEQERIASEIKNTIYHLNFLIEKAAKNNMAIDLSVFNHFSDNARKLALLKSECLIIRGR